MSFIGRNMLKHSIKSLQRKRLKYFLLFVVLLSFVFITYQLAYFNELNTVKSSTLVRGTHERQIMFYAADDDNKFTCIRSKEVIHYSMVNDDYCDCSDGSDEPGTNACPNGIFFCTDNGKNHHKFLPSTMVNDGICDCCDGSDEWANRKLHSRLQEGVQVSLGRYMSPCRDYC